MVQRLLVLGKIVSTKTLHFQTASTDIISKYVPIQKLTLLIIFFIYKYNF